MKYSFDTRLGEQLYRLLPEVYRTRDLHDQETGRKRQEDLAHYLDAHGYLLDLIHATLEQQLKDTQPKRSQDWLLPYFAQLLAVNIVSPDSEGKHLEVDKAVSWRQRKGTLKVAEEISESIGQMEAEIQEGWKRVAMTPRIDMPLMPISVIDNTLVLDESVPSQAAQHPSLPAVMMDLRRPSRAVEALPTNPAAKVSTFGGQQLSWRQHNNHGTPCFPGSFDDVSRRTVDMRITNKTQGYYHHKRMLAYVPPPSGLIPMPPIEITWEQRTESLYEHMIEETIENDVVVYRNATDRVVVVTNNLPLFSGGSYRVEGIHFLGKLTVQSDSHLELVNTCVDHVDAGTPLEEKSIVVAKDSLFRQLSAGGLVELDSCTVLEQAALVSIKAIDSIFMSISGTDITGVLEYSCYQSITPFDTDKTTIENCTTDAPVFFIDQDSLNARSVLSPVTAESIIKGASDAAEMGYFHHGRSGRPVRISGDFTAAQALELPSDGDYTLEDLIFEGNVEVKNGRLLLLRCAIPELEVNSIVSITDDDFLNPTLSAEECLFDKVTVPDALTRLEYCTVMQLAECKYLQASDCIFMDLNVFPAAPLNNPNCVRYSRIPPASDVSSMNAIAGYSSTNTTVTPVFIKADYCHLKLELQDVGATGDLINEGRNLLIVAFVAGDLYIRLFNANSDRLIDKDDLTAGGKLTALKQLVTDVLAAGNMSLQEKQKIISDAITVAGYTRTARTAEFGEAGYGVLDRSTPDTIRFGAEDGAEMGAHHHRLYSLKIEAVLDKLREFLPVDIEPVLIEDRRLLQLPPELRTTNQEESP